LSYSANYLPKFLLKASTDGDISIAFANLIMTEWSRHVYTRRLRREKLLAVGGKASQGDMSPYFLVILGYCLLVCPVISTRCSVICLVSIRMR